MSVAFRRGIRPPSELLPPDWAGKFVRVANSERAPHFDISQTPWWRRPMEAAADPEVTNIVVLAPTGSGKSTMAEGLIPWIVAEDPGPLLYASQTDEDAKFWAESRLTPALKSCPQLKDLWPEDRHKSRKMEIIWPHMPMVLGGANLSNFQEKSCRWLYGDEVWKWNHGLVREFMARHHNRWNRKVFLVSQGGVGNLENDDGKSDELTVEWKKTDRAEWSWLCPHCQNRHPYSGLQLKVDDVRKDDGTIDPQATADTCRLECPSCQAIFADDVSTRRALADSAEYVSTAKPLRGFIGCHVHALAIWWIPWAEYALERINAQLALKRGITDPLRQLIQKRDALPWSDDMAESGGKLVVSGYSRDDYATGEPIEGESRRFMTIDAGGDHYWTVIRAWKPGGASKQVYEGYVGSDADLIALQKRFRVKSSHVFIDRGFETGRIDDLCVANGWWGVMGDKARSKSFKHAKQGGGSEERPYSPVHYARAPKGGRSRYVILAPDTCKDILHRLKTGQGAAWEVPGDVSPAYRNQIEAEKKQSFRNTKTGQEDHTWVKVRRANHLFDCEYYQIGAALIGGIFDG